MRPLSRIFLNRLPENSLALSLLGAADAVCKVQSGQSLPSAIALSCQTFGITYESRAAVQDIAYHATRYLGLAQFLQAKLMDKKPKQPLLAGVLLCALSLIACGHVNGVNRYETYTVVDQAVRAVASLRDLMRAKGVVNAVLRRYLRERETLMQQAKADEVATWNYPAWWIAKMKQAYPQDWRQILEAGNTMPPLALRVNRRKSTVADYREMLQSHQITSIAVGEDGVVLDKAIPVTDIPGFAEGVVSVQDVAAQMAAPLLKLTDGMRVLDACAAPGGKSCHMLECADVELLALDSDASRLEMVQENLTRLGLRAKTKVGDASNSDWWDGVPFDAILADVPCSASGVLRRHPDIRWLRRPEDAQALSVVAKKILENLWPKLKKNGYLLLATCSIWPEESELQAKQFEKLAGAVRLSAPGQLLPKAGQTSPDGLFYALFQKQ